MMLLDVKVLREVLMVVDMEMVCRICKMLESWDLHHTSEEVRMLDKHNHQMAIPCRRCVVCQMHKAEVLLEAVVLLLRLAVDKVLEVAEAITLEVAVVRLLVVVVMLLHLDFRDWILG